MKACVGRRRNGFQALVRHLQDNSKTTAWKAKRPQRFYRLVKINKFKDQCSEHQINRRETQLAQLNIGNVAFHFGKRAAATSAKCINVSRINIDSNDALKPMPQQTFKTIPSSATDNGNRLREAFLDNPAKLLEHLRLSVFRQRHVLLVVG